MNRADDSSEQSHDNISTIIEASWAPADPRDKLYDETASKSEKTSSIFRVLAAFHPVLNVPVLMYDSFKRLGVLKGLLLWCVVLFILVALITVFSE